MPIRFYFSQVIGTGAKADTFRPAVMDAGGGFTWMADEGRANQAAAGGEMFVRADVTPAQHAAIVADVRNTYLPLEGVGGVLRTPADPISSVTAANRTTITTICEARHVPIDGLDPADPIRLLGRRIRWRHVLRQWLGAIDLTEGLDTLVSAIPLARRQAINARLAEVGFNSRDAGVVGTDTVRAAIRKMILEREQGDANG